jgi:hypothetical protein
MGGKMNAQSVQFDEHFGGPGIHAYAKDMPIRSPSLSRNHCRHAHVSFTARGKNYSWESKYMNRISHGLQCIPPLIAQTLIILFSPINFALKSSKSIVGCMALKAWRLIFVSFAGWHRFMPVYFLLGLTQPACF